MNRLLGIFRSPVALGGLIAAGIVFAVAAAAIVTGGFTQAQESTATPSAGPAAATATPGSSDGAGGPVTAKGELREGFLDGLATELGITRDQLDQAIRNASLDIVDAAVADGRITEEEAAHIRDAIESGKFPFFGGPRFHHRGFFLGRGTVNDIAGFLGVDRQVIVDGLQNDQSLAQIAEANGKSRDELKSFLLSNITQKVNQALADGALTQDRADEILQNAPARIDQLIDHVGLPGPGLKGGPRDGLAPQGLPDLPLADPLAGL